MVTGWAMHNAEVPLEFEARLMLPESVLASAPLMAELGDFLCRDAAAQGAQVLEWGWRVVDPADYVEVPAPPGWSLVVFELHGREVDPITSAIEPVGARPDEVAEGDEEAEDLPPLAGAVFEEVPSLLLHEPDGKVWCFCDGPGGLNAHLQGAAGCTSVLTDG